MVVINRSNLNENLKNDEVDLYCEILSKKKVSLYVKRIFDIVVSLILIILLFPLFAFIALSIKWTSKGPVFYRQERVTLNYKIFKIFKIAFKIVVFPVPGPPVIIESPEHRHVLIASICSSE